MRVVVVGSGIAGLASAWLLSRRHEVHLIERDTRLGGHTNTVGVAQPDGSSLGVDTGFIVHNTVTYPLLVRLFDELGVATQPSDMSWSVHCERCRLEYAGSLSGVFADRRRVADPRHLRMVADVSRFNRLGRRLLDRGVSGTVGELLDAHHFSRSFRNHHLLPMAAAIWSTGTGSADGFPAATLLRFFANHGLLSVNGHLSWRTVTGGSSSYVPALTAPLGDRVHRGHGVVGIARDDAGVVLRLGDGTTMDADRVVIATHADEALGLLDDATPQEKELLGAWDYSTNEAVLHTDVGQLPTRRAAWASWNYRLTDCTVSTDRVSLGYHMNRLQRLDAPEEYVVTLNPTTPIDEHRILRRFTYTHPVYSTASVATHDELASLNGPRHTHFAGAYHRFGFHEDALWSAVRVADDLGVSWP
ncbi:MAG: FAD-dependent oxidoreductase [Nitriliruptoraceae bacterium]